MNKKLKILLGVVIGTIIFVLYLFCLALSDYNYNIIVTLKNFWIMFLFPIPFILLFNREKHIHEAPIQEIRAEVVNMQIGERRRLRHHRFHRYFLLTFKVKNELLWTFSVPVEVFNKTVIGQQGILSYRERNGKYYFVYFSNLDAVNNG